MFCYHLSLRWRFTNWITLPALNTTGSRCWGYWSLLSFIYWLEIEVLKRSNASFCHWTHWLPLFKFKIPPIIPRSQNCFSLQVHFKFQNNRQDENSSRSPGNMKEKLLMGILGHSLFSSLIQQAVNKIVSHQFLWNKKRRTSF